jgi:hypothetical protein
MTISFSTDDLFFAFDHDDEFFPCGIRLVLRQSSIDGLGQPGCTERVAATSEEKE